MLSLGRACISECERKQTGQREDHRDEEKELTSMQPWFHLSNVYGRTMSNSNSLYVPAPMLR